MIYIIIASLPEAVEPLALSKTDAVQRVKLAVLSGVVLGAVSQHLQVPEKIFTLWKKNKTRIINIHENHYGIRYGADNLICIYLSILVQDVSHRNRQTRSSMFL